MDDDWDDMELVEQDESVAQLEVKEPSKRVWPFYSREDLEDVDE